MSEPRIEACLPGQCSCGVRVIIFPDLSPRWAPSQPSGQADSLAKGQSEQKPVLSRIYPRHVALAVGTSCSGYHRPLPRPRVRALTERLRMENADCDSGILAWGLRDEELRRVGMGVFPAGVHPMPLHPIHSRVHPVPNHC